jgi:Amt family ammonium transporter
MTVLEERNFAASSPGQVALGTLILWVGWLFFNGGSTLGLTGRQPERDWQTAARAIANTILAPSAAGLSTLVIRKRITGESQDVRLDYAAFTNGILSGCVSVTASCNHIAPWAAVAVGLVASVVYSGACVLMKKLKVDDPLDAVQVHGCCGLWGVLAVAVFKQDVGLVYGGEGSLAFLGRQALGAACIAAWSGGLSAIYFTVAKRCGHLRLSAQEELLGGDIHYFAPKVMQGRISSYTQGLQMERLNSDVPSFVDVEDGVELQAQSSPHVVG